MKRVGIEGGPGFDAMALVVHAGPGKGFDGGAGGDVIIGVLVPTDRPEEVGAVQAGVGLRQGSGIEIEGEFVTARDDGEAVVAMLEEFADIAGPGGPTGRGDLPMGAGQELGIDGGQWFMPGKVGELAVASVMEICAGRIESRDAQVGVRGASEEGDAIPVDLEGLGEAETAGAFGELVGEIDDDGLGLAGGGSDGDGNRSPLVGGDLGFELGEGETEIGAMGGGDVGHAPAEAQPAVEDEPEGIGGGQRAEVEDQAVGLGKAAIGFTMGLGR